MSEKNMNGVDRAIRFLIGGALILVGLLLLNGAQGNLIGIVVAALALGPFTAGATGVCPIYYPLGISTLRSEPSSTAVVASGRES